RAAPFSARAQSGGARGAREGAPEDLREEGLQAVRDAARGDRGAQEIRGACGRSGGGSQAADAAAGEPRRNGQSGARTGAPSFARRRRDLFGRGGGGEEAAAPQRSLSGALDGSRAGQAALGLGLGGARGRGGDRGSRVAIPERIRRWRTRNSWR